MKNTLLIRTITIILTTVILSAVLTALVFNYSGRQIFSDIKAQEVSPRAKFIATLTADYMQGYISQSYYELAVNSEYRIWDASLYIFDSSGTLFVYPVGTDEMSDENLHAIGEHVQDVLSGSSIYQPDTSRSIGVIVGEPVVSRYGNVLGAVFMAKPLVEVSTAWKSLTIALVVSMQIVTLVMTVPAYLMSRGLVHPIRQMIDVSNAMANRDFGVRAQAKGNGELSQLGRALNHLSSELSAAIDELVFERNRLRTVLFGLGEGVVAVNAQGRVIQYNPAAVRLLGGNLDAGETPEQLEAYQRAVSEVNAVLSGEQQRVVEFQGAKAMLRVTVTALSEQDGNIEGALLLIQDVTEAIRLEQTRRDYVANVSHELRTPIASIRGLADALNDGLVKKQEDKERYYGYILHESMRLSRLIDDLLELSRLQSGTIAFTKRKTDLAEMLMDIAQRYEPTAVDKQIALDIRAPEHIGYVLTNQDRAEQVLIALLDNAIKHTPAGGTMTLKADVQEDRVVVSVINPGEIPLEDIDHLFERFYKVDKAHSGSGTGLGLAIASEIMALLGEQIWVENTDQGVRFAFTLKRFQSQCEIVEKA